MKKNIRPFPVLTRATLALGLGCLLSALPLGTASAQDSSATTTRSTGKVDPDQLNSEKPKLTADEQEFIKTAAAGNLAEVEMAELALKNGESAPVKEFAQRMITDHGKANKELEALAKRDNIADFKPMVSAEDQAISEKLAKLKGKEFDEAYINNAVEDHQKDVAEYSAARNRVVSEGLLDYVKTTEPIIGSHLAMAKKMQKSE